MTAELYSHTDGGFTLKHSAFTNEGGSFKIGDKSYPLPGGLGDLVAVFDGKYSSADDLTITKTH